MKVDQPTLNAVPGAEVWPLSVAAYHVLGEAGLIPKRTELLYGFVYHKMPKSPFHSFLVTRLAGLVRKFLPAGWVMRTERPITCADSEPEPDVAVVRGKETHFRYEHPHTAELVIEMCVSSHEYDRSKIRAYASAGLKECWLVLGLEKQIEVHRQPTGEQFAESFTQDSGGRLVSAAVPGFSLELDALFSESELRRA